MNPYGNPPNPPYNNYYQQHNNTTPGPPQPPWQAAPPGPFRTGWQDPRAHTQSPSPYPPPTQQAQYNPGMYGPMPSAQTQYGQVNPAGYSQPPGDTSAWGGKQNYSQHRPDHNHGHPQQNAPQLNPPLPPQIPLDTGAWGVKHNYGQHSQDFQYGQHQPHRHQDSYPQPSQSQPALPPRPPSAGTGHVDQLARPERTQTPASFTDKPSDQSDPSVSQHAHQPWRDTFLSEQLGTNVSSAPTPPPPPPRPIEYQTQRLQNQASISDFPLEHYSTKPSSHHYDPQGQNDPSKSGTYHRWHQPSVEDVPVSPEDRQHRRWTSSGSGAFPNQSQPSPPLPAVHRQSLDLTGRPIRTSSQRSRSDLVSATALGAGTPSDWEHFGPMDSVDEDSFPSELPSAPSVSAFQSHPPVSSQAISISTPIRPNPSQKIPNQPPQSRPAMQVVSGPDPAGTAANQPARTSSTPSVSVESPTNSNNFSQINNVVPPVRHSSVSRADRLGSIRRTDTIDNVIQVWNAGPGRPIHSAPIPETPISAPSPLRERPLSPAKAPATPIEEIKPLEQTSRPTSRQMPEPPAPLPPPAVADPYGDLGPEGQASLARYVKMLREEGSATSYEDKYKIFQAFMKREKNLRIVLYEIPPESAVVVAAPAPPIPAPTAPALIQPRSVVPPTPDASNKVNEAPPTNPTLPLETSFQIQASVAPAASTVTSSPEVKSSDKSESESASTAFPSQPDGATPFTTAPGLPSAGFNPDPALIKTPSQIKRKMLRTPSGASTSSQTREQPGITPGPPANNSALSTSTIAPTGSAGDETAQSLMVESAKPDRFTENGSAPARDKGSDHMPPAVNPDDTQWNLPPWSSKSSSSQPAQDSDKRVEQPKLPSLGPRAVPAQDHVQTKDSPSGPLKSEKRSETHTPPPVTKISTDDIKAKSNATDGTGNEEGEYSPGGRPKFRHIISTPTQTRKPALPITPVSSTNQDETEGNYSPGGRPKLPRISTPNSKTKSPPPVAPSDEDGDYSPGGRPRFSRTANALNSTPERQPPNTGISSPAALQRNIQPQYPQQRLQWDDPPSPASNAPMVIEDYLPATSPGAFAPMSVSAEDMSSRQGQRQHDAGSQSHSRGNSPLPAVAFSPPRPVYTPFRYDEGTQRELAKARAALDGSAEDTYATLRHSVVESGRVLAHDPVVTLSTSSPVAPPEARPATASPMNARRQHQEMFLGVIRSQSNASRRGGGNDVGAGRSTTMRMPGLLQQRRSSTPLKKAPERPVTDAVTALRNILPKTTPPVEAGRMHGKIQSIRQAIDVFPDDFGYIRETVVTWDRSNLEVRKRQDAERQARITESETHIDELYNAHEIVYAEIGPMEAEFRLAETKRKYDEDQQELESFIASVFTPISDRLSNEVAQLNPQLDTAMELLKRDSEAASRLFQPGGPADGIQMTASLEMVLHIFKKLDVRYQKLAEARFERERRRKRLELTVLHANRNVAAVRDLEEEFETAEKLQVVREAQGKDERANRLVNGFDETTARGLGDNQTFVDDLLAKLRKLKDALAKDPPKLPGDVSDEDGTRQTLGATQDALDYVLADSRSILTLANVADKLLNDADYAISVAKARITNAGPTVFQKLQADKASEDEKLSEEMGIRIDSMAKGPAEATILLHDLVVKVGEDPAHHDRIQRALEEAKKRNAAKET